MQASQHKGGCILLDDSTSSMGTHSKGGLFKTFTDQQSSSTVTGGVRCAETMLAVFTNETPNVIKEEAVLTRVAPIAMPEVGACASIVLSCVVLSNMHM